MLRTCKLDRRYNSPTPINGKKTEYRNPYITYLTNLHVIPMSCFILFTIWLLGELHILLNILQQELIRAGVLPEDYDFEAHKELVPMQPGDVPVTYADTTALEEDFGFRPSTSLREGLRKFAGWYREFYM